MFLVFLSYSCKYALKSIVYCKRAIEYDTFSMTIRFTASVNINTKENPKTAKTVMCTSREVRLIHLLVKYGTFSSIVEPRVKFSDICALLCL